MFQMWRALVSTFGICCLQIIALFYCFTFRERCWFLTIFFLLTGVTVLKSLRVQLRFSLCLKQKMTAGRKHEGQMCTWFTLFDQINKFWSDMSFNTQNPLESYHIAVHIEHDHFFPSSSGVLMQPLWGRLLWRLTLGRWQIVLHFCPARLSQKRCLSILCTFSMRTGRPIWLTSL